DFKLIVPAGSNPWGDFLNGTALFNVAEDPDETEDLSRSVEFSGIRHRLETLLDDWWMPKQ
ncbi:MAG: hypothetical protein AAF357_17165, partial [Verrucomicrobiota bacterium]